MTRKGGRGVSLSINNYGFTTKCGAPLQLASYGYENRSTTNDSRIVFPKVGREVLPPFFGNYPLK